MTRTGATSRAGLWLSVALFALVAVVGVLVRPALARDETRYLSVAWEMWLSADWLVPHINGETYSHKPPALFWLINAGWRVFGVSEFWARLAAPLCGLACLGLVWRLARMLWPESGWSDAHNGARPHRPHARPWIAPVILATSAGWMLFASLTMFDAPLTLCVLAALIGVVKARADAPVRGFVLAGLAMGAGILTKGPVVFLHMLPVMLLAPWWGTGDRGASPGSLGPRRIGNAAWYAGVVGAVMIAVAVALAWALPAAKAGGEKFGDEILWGQSAGRMVQSFRHARPWWFYFPIVPALLFPWSAWPPVWRGVARFGHLWHDAGVRLLLAWLIPGFLAFSLVSGKQAHYLLPMLAGASVLLARLLALEEPEREERGDQRPIGVMLVLAGMALLAFPAGVNASPAFADWIDAPAWAYEHHPVAVATLIAFGVLLLAWDARGPARRVPLIATVCAVAVSVAQWDAMRSARASLDLSPMGRALRAVELEDRPVAHLGEYHGQYHFAGRLERPFTILWDTGAAQWARENPGGVVVGPYDNWPLDGAGVPLFHQPSGSHTIIAWNASQVLSGEAVLNQRGSRTRNLLPTGESAPGEDKPSTPPTPEDE